MKQKGITLRNGCWQVRTTYKGQPIYRQFPTGTRAGRKLAENYLQAEKERIAQGQYVEVHKTLEEVYEIVEGRKRTKREQSRIVTNNNFEHIAKSLDRDKYIDIFTEYDIQDFEEDILSSGLQPRTQGAVISLLKQIFRYALKRKWVSADVAGFVAGLDKPKIPTNGTVKVFTDDEIQKLTTEAKRKFNTNPNLLGMLALGIYGGLRCSEMTGLQWKDIDFEKHIMHIERQYHSTLKVFTEPKTDSSKTWIPIYPELQDVLTRIHNKVKGLAGYKDTNCILTAYHKGYMGKPLNRNSLRRGLGDLTKRCGLPIETGLHSLRRTCGTRLAKKDLARASNLLRHGDVKTTWKYYTNKDSLKENMLKEMYPKGA